MLPVGTKGSYQLTTKNSKEVAQAFQWIYRNTLLTYPKTPIIDDGKEFYGDTTKLMEKHDVIIEHGDPSQHRSGGIVERFTHICRIKRCGGAGCPPPPIIFERLKLPQQIIYRQKENLSESPNHKKYWENILVSRFYEQFSRNRRNLGHFWKFEYLNFAKIKAIMHFAKFLNAYVKPRNLNFSRNKLYIWNLQITCFKVIYNMFIF